MATTTPEHDAKIAALIFGKIYPLYLKKVERKGRSEAELREVLRWLTGFTDKQLQKCIDDDGLTIEGFFAKARLNPNADLITGVICGYRVEDIETPLTRQARAMDKLVDELAKGKKMEKILR